MQLTFKLVTVLALAQAILSIPPPVSRLPPNLPPKQINMVIFLLRLLKKYQLNGISTKLMVADTAVQAMIKSIQPVFSVNPKPPSPLDYINSVLRSQLQVLSKELKVQVEAVQGMKNIPVPVPFVGPKPPVKVVDPVPPFDVEQPAPPPSKVEIEQPWFQG